MKYPEDYINKIICGLINLKLNKMKNKTFELAERLADEAFGSNGVIEYSSRQELTSKFYAMLKSPSAEFYSKAVICAERYKQAAKAEEDLTAAFEALVKNHNEIAELERTNEQFDDCWAEWSPTWVFTKEDTLPKHPVKGTWNEEKLNKIMVDILRDEMMSKDIAQKYGCTPAYVSIVKKKAKEKGYLSEKGIKTDSGREFVKNQMEMKDLNEIKEWERTIK